MGEVAYEFAWSQHSNEVYSYKYLKYINEFF